MLETGKKYPLAFLLFRCSECTGNYLNHSHTAVTAAMLELDPGLDASHVHMVGGDLWGWESIRVLVDHVELGVDLSRLTQATADDFQNDVWRGEVYAMGILFTALLHVESVHEALSAASVAGYLGMFSFPITAGATDMENVRLHLGLLEMQLSKRV